MARKMQTMDLKGKAYAKVAERTKEFRQDNPRGKIQTDHIYLEDGNVEFKAWVWKDKTDLIELMKAGVTDPTTLRDSADANGTAKKVTEDVKDFEKLETIAVGRALALLGYLASGEIASSEEMEEFEDWRNDRYGEQVVEAIDKINGAKTLDDLKTVWSSLGTLMTNEEVIKAKDARKAVLSDASNQG